MVDLDARAERRRQAAQRVLALPDWELNAFIAMQDLTCDGLEELPTMLIDAALVPLWPFEEERVAALRAALAEGREA